MNETEVNKQIEHMVAFIRQEAVEKANEIRMSSEEEFNLEKLNLLETEKQRIRKEYERKEAQVEANKKIEASKQQNEQRLKLLGAKQRLIKQVFESAKNELKRIAASSKYEGLMADLLCQGMYKLQEPSQIVQCRQADLQVLEAALPKAQHNYKALYKKDPPQITVDRKHFLPKAAASKAQEDDPDHPTCLGGVVVISPDGRIVVNNTLDTRLRLVEETQLPAIRELLFS